MANKSQVRDLDKLEKQKAKERYVQKQIILDAVSRWMDVDYSPGDVLQIERRENHTGLVHSFDVKVSSVIASAVVCDD